MQKLLTKETLSLFIFLTIFSTIVIYFSYSDQEERKNTLKNNEYKFSNYQLQNGAYISFSDHIDDNGYVNIVLVGMDSSHMKLLKVKEKYLYFGDGPLTKLSKSFFDQKQEFEKNKNTIIQKTISKKESERLPILKIKHL